VCGVFMCVTHSMCVTFMCVTWLTIRVGHELSAILHMNSLRIAWVLHTCDVFMCVVYSYVRRIHLCDLCMCLKHSYVCLVYVCDMTYYKGRIRSQSKTAHEFSGCFLSPSNVWRIHVCDLFMCVNYSCVWLIHVCDSFIRVSRLCMWHDLL